MQMEYAITGIIVAVLVVGIIWACLARKKLLDNGEIIKRKMNFMKMAEVFTLITPDPHTVVEKIKSFPVIGKTVAAQWDEAKQYFEFNYYKSWTASMKKIKEDDGKSVYYFSFNHFKSNNGTPEGSLDANKLLTSLEKMFLEFDPNTQVHNEAVDFKTKHHFF